MRFAMPVMFALFLQAMYGAVDLFVVGKFATSEDVSAVVTGSQIMMTLGNLVTSLAMGATIFLGQQIGMQPGGNRHCLPVLLRVRLPAVCVAVRSHRLVCGE